MTQMQKNSVCNQSDNSIDVLNDEKQIIEENNSEQDDNMQENRINVQDLIQSDTYIDVQQPEIQKSLPYYQLQLQKNQYLINDQFNESSDIDNEQPLVQPQKFTSKALKNLFLLKKELHDKCIKNKNDQNENIDIYNQYKQQFDNIFQQIDQDSKQLEEQLQKQIIINQQLKDQTFEAITKHNNILQQYKMNTLKIKEAREVLALIKQLLDNQISIQNSQIIMDQLLNRKKRQINEQKK